MTIQWDNFHWDWSGGSVVIEQQSLGEFVLLYKICVHRADMSNSIETAIAIAFFGTIAIDIAIAKAIFQLLLLLLILLREFSNYCYCCWYC